MANRLLCGVLICVAASSGAAAPTPPGTTYARGRIVIPGVESAVAIAAGNFHIVVINSSGHLVGWGDNAAHQIDVPFFGDGYERVAAGRLHSLAATRDSIYWHLRGVGDDSFDQLSGPPWHLLTEILGLGAGRAHSIALSADHTVLAWGDNAFGQTDVPTGLTGVGAIAAGDDHSLALLLDGTVVAWGSNRSGQCDVPLGLVGVTAIDAGASHSLAVFDAPEGEVNVVGWGDNTYGQTDAPPSAIGATNVAAGSYHSLALLSDGTVVCWGANNYGQCDGPEGLAGVVALAAGERASYAILSDGSIEAWGLVPFTCDGDMNGDNRTDVFDFALLARSFGQSGATRAEGDLNGDGVVDVFDFAIFASDFECLIEGASP